MAARSEYFAASDARQVVLSFSGQHQAADMPSRQIQKEEPTLNIDEHFETEALEAEEVQLLEAFDTACGPGCETQEYVLPVATLNQMTPYTHSLQKRTSSPIIRQEAQYTMQQVDTFGIIQDREVPSYPDSSRDFGIANQSPFFHNHSLQHSETSSSQVNINERGSGTRGSLQKQETSNRRKKVVYSRRQHFLASGSVTKCLPKGKSRQQRNSAGLETGFFSHETLSKYPMLSNLKIVNSRQQKLPNARVPLLSLQQQRPQDRMARSNDNLFSFQELPAEPVEIVPFESTHALPSPGFFVHKNGRQSKDVPMMATTFPNGKALEKRPQMSTKSSAQPTKTLKRIQRYQSSLKQATSEAETVDQAVGNSLAIDVNAKPVYRTLDSSEFEKACMQAATFIEHLQKSTKRLRKTNLDSPRGTIPPSSMVKHKMKSLNFRGGSGSICTVPSANKVFHSGRRAGSLSENRSNSAREHSSTKTPLVMRYCFHNHEDKKKLVEANKAAWLEQRESLKAISNSPMSTYRSPGSSLDKMADKPISLAKKFVFRGSTKLIAQRSASPKIQIKEVVGSNRDMATTAALPQKLQQKASLPKTLIIGGSTSQKKSRNSTNQQSSNFGNQTIKNESRLTKTTLLIDGKIPARQNMAKFKSPLNYQKGNKKAFSPLSTTANPSLITNSAVSGKLDSNLPSRVPYQSGAQKKSFQLPTSLLMKTAGAGKHGTSVQLQQARLPHSNTVSPRPITAAGASSKEATTKPGGKNFKLPTQQSMKSTSLVQGLGSVGPKEKSIQNQAIQNGYLASQVISAHSSTVLTTRRDSKYLQHHSKYPNSKATAQGLTRSTNSSIYNPLQSKPQQQRFPLQKSVVSCNPPLSQKSTVLQVSSLFLSTVSPEKYTPNNDAMITSDLLYPPVQTSTCSKPEIFITTSMTATQKKSKQVFSNSVVTKSTLTKPSATSCLKQNPTLTKHSHRKSSDYYFGGGGGSSWKNYSLVHSQTTGGPTTASKLIGTSALQTPIKVETARPFSNTTGITKKQQLGKSGAVFIGGGTTGNSKSSSQHKTQTGKSRKHCQKALTFYQAAGSLHKKTGSSNLKSRLMSPGNGSQIATPALPQEQGPKNQSHLDTIESVDLTKGQKDVDRQEPTMYQLGKSTSRNQGKTSATVTSISGRQKRPISSQEQKHNSSYKLPDAAESPTKKLVNEHLREQLVQKPLVSPPYRSKGETNWQKATESIKATELQLAQATSYEKGLEAKDCLQLRGGSNEKSKERIGMPTTLRDLLLMPTTIDQEGSLTPKDNQTGEKSIPKDVEQVQPPPVCCSLLPQSVSKPLSQYGFTEDNINGEDGGPMMSPQESHFHLARSKLTKENSYSSHSGGGVGNQDKGSKSRLPLGPDKKRIKQLEKRIKSQLHSLQASHQGSIVNLSLAKTESIAFQPSNPLRILRDMQRDKNYVWLAIYDEDILHSGFMRKIGQCTDRCLPWEFVPWRLQDVQPFLLNENCLCLRREPGKETLCKIYLVHIEQVKDIVRLKNHYCDKKKLFAEGLVQCEDDYWQPMDELRKKYTVTKLSSPKHKFNDSSSFSDDISSLKNEYVPVDKTVNASIPEERTAICKVSPDQQLMSNFIVTMEQQREFDDLEDIENPPVLDLIYHEQMAMGLPVVFATNRDQSKLDDSIPQTPSYFKHLRSMKPSAQLLTRMLQGLISCFQDLTPDELMRNYIEQIPGIQGKLSEEEIREIVEKSVSGVSIWSDQPHTKLMSPQQTQKMFSLMYNNQVDPSDLHGGYQSLTAYEELEAQQQYMGCEPIDKDVVFLGAEESSYSLDKQDLSLNQLQMIEQFNRDFQLQQQQFMLSSGIKSGLPGVCSSDTSQVDNFIFQNNINRLSNEVSQEFSDVTPVRDALVQRNNVASKTKFGTTGMQSRGASSHRQGSENTTSYQGACRILNFQQPFFQGNHWRDTSDDFGKDEVPSQTSKNMINRGSSLGLLSQLPSPPFKQMKQQQVYSARKTQLFSQEHSAIDIKSIGGIPTAKKTVLTNHKYFDSHHGNSARDNTGAGEFGGFGTQIVQPGFEIPVDDFCTNVDSIKPLAQENGSTHQASNSLFIQSGRSRNKANSHAQTKPSCTLKNKPLNVDPENRFELSQDNFDKALIEGQEFEEVMCPDIDSNGIRTDLKYDTGNGPKDQAKFAEVNNLIDDQLSSEEEDPVSIREQLVSELSIRRKRKDSNSKCKELERRLTSKFTDCDGVSQPQVELFEHMSDIVRGGNNHLIPCQSSKELVLEEETKMSPVHSYRKVRHSLTKHIQMTKVPFKKKKVMTEEKNKDRLDLMATDPDFMEGTFDLMNSQAIRGELFRTVGMN